MSTRRQWLASGLACCVAASAHAQAGFSYVFEAPEGSRLVGLTPAADGSVYARLARGGPNDEGTVVRRMPDGQTYTVHAFHAGIPPQFIDDPYAPLSFDRDGALYGTSSWGGAFGYGSLFRLDDCNGFEVVHDFTRADGGRPRGPLLPAADGGFYVVTNSDNGKVLHVAGDGETRTVHEGLYKPEGGVILASDGYLYGTLPFIPGAGNEPWEPPNPPERLGALYRVRPDGSEFSFALRVQPEFFDPRGQLAEGPDGYLYGTSDDRTGPGPHVFRVPLGAAPFDYSKVAPDGLPQAGLSFLADGSAYGAGQAYFRLSTAGVLTYIRDFDSDAPKPTAALQPHPDRGVYVPAGEHLLHMTEAGDTSVLHRFGYQQGDRLAGLWQGRDGLVYGRSIYGGAHGTGTLFRFGADGSFHTLLSWNASRVGALAEADDGTLYGIREGDRIELVSVTPSGELSVLCELDRALLSPHRYVRVVAGPVIGQDRAWYGVTASNDDYPWATPVEAQVFRIDPSSAELSVLARMANRNVGVMVSGLDGSLYMLSGLTDQLGDTRLTRVTSDGQVSDVHRFSTDSEGYLPRLALAVASDGGIYGFAGPQAPDRPSVIYRWDNTHGMSIEVTLPSVYDYSQLSIAPDDTLILKGLPDGGWDALLVERSGRVVTVPGPLLDAFSTQDSQIYRVERIWRGQYSGFSITPFQR
jgi:uncharacterized repeat protein (TIGR03803 family)